MVLLSAVGAFVLRDRDEGPSPLTMEGTVLEADGGRFVLAGASAYIMPFYTAEDGGRDEALAGTTEGAYDNLGAVLEEMSRSGVNTLRVPVAVAGYEEDIYELGGKGGYLDRLRQVVEAAADEDIRVVVGWWDSHSLGAEWLDRYTESFAMMADVHDALEPWPSVVYEPFNEPHDITWEQWEPVMEDVVRYWRDDLGYDGVLLLDTIDYSWSFDPDVAQRVLDLDAGLRDGEPAVVFANHRYANDQTCFCGAELDEWEQEVGQYVDDFPIAGTEYGRWTGPDFQPQEQWNVEFAQHAAQVAVPAGMNGYLAFVWDWVDENAMTEPGGLRLNAYGQLITDEVFRRHGLS